MVRNGMVKGLIIKIVKKMKTYIYILKYIYLFNKTRHSYIYMLSIATLTAGPIGLKFFVDTHV